MLHLAAIVRNSDDAIISKTLDSRITSWNEAATRMFGWTAEEMIGNSILRLLPDDLKPEEDIIIARLKAGERIDHYDTERVTRHGRRLNVSLTVSPLRGRDGMIIGASKIARDITARKESERLQSLLFEELNHRVKNTLATIQSIASQSMRLATSPASFTEGFNGRIRALSLVHDALVRGKMQGGYVREIVTEQVLLGQEARRNVSFAGPAVLLDAQAAVNVALIVHELATNSRKYGSLSEREGLLAVNWEARREGEETALRIDWRETGMCGIRPPDHQGFGSKLIAATAKASGGSYSTDYQPAGMSARVELFVHEASGPSAALSGTAKPASADMDIRGVRVLVVEDEPLIAMDTADQLEQLGCVVTGVAGSVEAALKAASALDFDMALLDANLAGRQVDDVADLLKRRAVPFAFATGYSADVLPRHHQAAPLLRKPLSAGAIKTMIVRLLGLG